MSCACSTVDVKLFSLTTKLNFPHVFFPITWLYKPPVGRTAALLVRSLAWWTLWQFSMSCGRSQSAIAYWFGNTVLTVGLEIPLRGSWSLLPPKMGSKHWTGRALRINCCPVLIQSAKAQICIKRLRVHRKLVSWKFLLITWMSEELKTCFTIQKMLSWKWPLNWRADVLLNSYSSLWAYPDLFPCYLT